MGFKASYLRFDVKGVPVRFNNFVDIKGALRARKRILN